VGDRRETEEDEQDYRNQEGSDQNEQHAHRSNQRLHCPI
jgi:hypothetical protein